MRKRSKYRPKGAILDTLAWIKEGMTPVAATSGNAGLRIRNHGAMAALAKGQATKADMDALIGMVNMSEAFRMKGLGSDWATELRAGMEAVEAICVRAITHRRFVATGPELTALNLALDIHDAQLDAATVADIDIRTVQRTIAARKAVRLEAVETNT